MSPSTQPPVRDPAFPASSPPDADETSAFEDEQFSESGAHPVIPSVALAVFDPQVRAALSTLLQRAGRVVGGDDLVPVAAAVITDARGGARAAVAGLRATARSDAAIIVVLPAGAPASQVAAAYDAGAALCLQAPLDDHQILGAVGSAIDLRTAKVHADVLTRQLDVQAHMASLGRVTAGFTHEVSNPLSAVTANFEFVRENMEWLLQARDLLAGPAGEATRIARERLSRVSPSDVRDALKDIDAALERVRAVLDQARELAQARLTSRFEEVQLVDVVRDVRRWAEEDLRGVEVQELIDRPLAARADPRLLGQIVLNLVSNAAHAARLLPAPRVRLHVYGTASTAILSVRDNGPGIAPDVRDRIFEPFFTTRRGKGGTGLGLALCREYAAQMQAHISVWTAPGRGACFRVHMRRHTP